MYQSIPLVSIPYTLKQLGSPIEVGGEPNDYDEMQPTVNYSMRVQIRSAIDTLVGKITNLTEDGGYSGQPKIVRHTNGHYYLAYVGLDRLYTSDFTTDPTDWVNSGWANFDYVEKDSYITLTSENATWKKYYKNFGTNYFTYDNDVILRFTIRLPEMTDYAYVWPNVGFLPSTATSPTNTIGVAFVQVGSPPALVWYAGCYRDGSSQPGNLIALEANVIYTVDIVLQRSTNNLLFRITLFLTIIVPLDGNH